MQKCDGTDGMKVVDLRRVAARRRKVKYIIQIGDDEKPLYAANEQRPGTMTIMVTARTVAEAEVLRKQATALVMQGLT